MSLTNDKERKICKKYGTRDSENLVHCNECPLRKGVGYDFRCKANSHYNRSTKEWEYDEDQFVKEVEFSCEV